MKNQSQDLSNSISQNHKIGLKALLNIDSQNKNQYDTQPQNDADKIPWKIIVYDQYCKEILSTLFKVGNLREENITLHLDLLNNQREKLHGVKAFYFVQPIQENIDQIISDFKQDLYDYVYINFAYPISSNLLEKLAREIGKTQQTYKVQSVQQHSLNFISLNKNLFAFNYQEIYRNISSIAQQKENFSLQNPKVLEIVDKIATNLYCVCRQMNAIPTIIYKQDNKIHKLICEKVDDIFKNQYLQTEDFKKLEGNFNEYILLLHDRTSDLGTILLHPWHYGALIHDVLQISNNKVEMENEITKNKKEIYDLDPQSDTYWSQKMNQPFPDVIEDIPKQVDRFQKDYNNMEFKKKNEGQDQQSESIAKALDQVTDMKERKKKLDIHTNLANHITNQIEVRQLDQFFEVGSALIFNSYLDKEQVKQLFELIENKSNLESDKLRLLILYAVYDQEQKHLQQLIEKSGIKQEKNLKLLEFVKTLNAASKKTDSKREYLFNFAQKMAKKVNLTKEKDPIVIYILKQIISEFSRSTSSNNMFINPNNNNNDQSQQQIIIENHTCYKIYKGKCKNNNSNIANNIIVFGVEGGGYAEYQAVTSYGEQKNINIIYGGSTIFSAKDLLTELSEIV